MQNEPKRCPSCGGKAEVDTITVLYPHSNKSHIVDAVICQCGWFTCGLSKDDAIKTWNRMVEDAE